MVPRRKGRFSAYDALIHEQETLQEVELVQVEQNIRQLQVLKI